MNKILRVGGKNTALNFKFQQLRSFVNGTFDLFEYREKNNNIKKVNKLYRDEYAIDIFICFTLSKIQPLVFIKMKHFFSHFLLRFLQLNHFVNGHAHFKKLYIQML